MSGFLLDTNVPSELIRPQPEPKVVAWVDAQKMSHLFLSAVSFGEFSKGIALRPPGKRRTQLENWLQTDIKELFAGRILPLTRSIRRALGCLGGAARTDGTPSARPRWPDRGDRP